MSDFFPVLQPQIEEITEPSLPLYEECAWDFENARPIFENGEPKIIVGKEALKVWCWKTLRTALGQYPIYNHSHGHQLEELIGQPYTEATKKAEAIRFVQEALLVNPYITKVSEEEISFHGSAVRITVSIESDYGEVTVNV